MNYREKLKAAQERFNLVKAVLGGDDATIKALPDAAQERVKEALALTPEERTAWCNGLVAEAKQLQKEAAQLKDIAQTAIDTAVAQAEAAQDDAPRSHGFKSWGEFLVVANDNMTLPKSQRDPRVVVFDEGPGARKDMAGSSLAGGGALIPQQFQEQLYALLNENSNVRAQATIIPMRRRQVLIPVLNQTTTTVGLPHWFGGLQFYWAEEGEEKTNSDVAFRQMALTAHKLVALTHTSDELLDDSAVSLEAFLQGPMGFAGGAAWMEEYAFIQGTGAGQPLGVINANATISVARATASTVGYTDIVNMVESLLPSSKAIWMITQNAMSNIIQMNGPTGNASYVWLPTVQGGAPGTLFGYPVVWTDKQPSVGTAGDVLLVDWSKYLVGDRQASTVSSTPFGPRWTYDQTSWRLVHRVDGQPWLSAPFTYSDGSTQVSPFVKLSDAAS